MDQKLELSLPDFSGINPEAIIEVLKKCEQGRGEDVLQDFEEDFKNLVNTKFCIPVSSATSGLHLALLALNIQKEDEVICPTFTFAASAFPILYQNASPVFVDSEPETWNISPEYLNEAIQDRIKKSKKPRAMVIVHGYGTPAKLKEILSISQEYKIPVIEDAASSLGSTYENKQVGTFGSVGVFSFNRNKIISGGSGGCVITNDEEIAKKIKYFAHQAKSNTSYYHHEAIGYNYGLSPILSEIIRLQLPGLIPRIMERRACFENYLSQFNTNTEYPKEATNSYSNRWLTVLKPKERERIQSEYRNVWKPMHLQPVFSMYPYFGNQESEKFFDTGICLPFLKTN